MRRPAETYSADSAQSRRSARLWKAARQGGLFFGVAGDGGRNRIDVWRAVAEEIQRTDGYGHPHSGHQWVLDVRTRPLGNEPWHDWFALQGGHRNSRLTPQARYAEYFAFQPVKPVLAAADKDSSARPDAPSTAMDAASSNASAGGKSGKRRPGHGRLPASAYTGCRRCS